MKWIYNKFLGMKVYQFIIIVLMMIFVVAYGFLIIQHTNKFIKECDDLYGKGNWEASKMDESYFFRKEQMCFPIGTTIESSDETIS